MFKMRQVLNGWKVMTPEGDELPYVYKTQEGAKRAVDSFNDYLRSRAFSQESH